ncbi:sortase domain-bontaining protein [Streptomyces polyrhachis]|uniref:Sortase domain-bontaining protein n=1 Tax=Streptomyces polyrhachis TaxID=1282885 RepID=A0ABW2GA09_9ACTN
MPERGDTGAARRAVHPARRDFAGRPEAGAPRSAPAHRAPGARRGRPPCRSRRAAAVRRARLTVLVALSLVLGTTAWLLTPKDEPQSRPVRHEPLTRSEPLRLRIPGIDLDAEVDSVGLAAGRVIGSPPLSALNTAGWYRAGVSPGEPGSAVITGHVDSDKQRAVFFRLSELGKGDRVVVSRADGTRAEFTVDERLYRRRADFPAERVLGGKGQPGLWLITCAPPFDRKTRSYESNLLVHARLSDVTAAKGARTGSRAENRVEAVGG